MTILLLAEIYSQNKIVTITSGTAVILLPEGCTYSAFKLLLISTTNDYVTHKINKKSPIANGRGPRWYWKKNCDNFTPCQISNQNKIIVTVASSGIDATLVPEGCTSYSVFKLLLGLATNDYVICPWQRCWKNAV